MPLWQKRNSPTPAGEGKTTVSFGLLFVPYYLIRRFKKEHINRDYLNELQPQLFRYINDYKWSGNPEQGVGFSVVLMCKNDINDLTFESTVVGTVEERKAIIDNPPIGKMVTIKFYERTKNGIPFHSNVIAIRDYE